LISLCFVHFAEKQAWLFNNNSHGLKTYGGAVNNGCRNTALQPAML